MNLANWLLLLFSPKIDFPCKKLDFHVTFVMKSGTESDAQNNTYTILRGWNPNTTQSLQYIFFSAKCFRFSFSLSLSLMRWNAVFNFTCCLLAKKAMKILCVAVIFVSLFFFSSLCYMRAFIDFGRISWYLPSVSNSHEHHNAIHWEKRERKKHCWHNQLSSSQTQINSNWVNVEVSSKSTKQTK